MSKRFLALPFFNLVTTNNLSISGDGVAFSADPEDHPHIDFYVPTKKDERVVAVHGLRQELPEGFMPSFTPYNRLQAIVSGLANQGLDWYDIAQINMANKLSEFDTGLVAALRWTPGSGQLSLVYREYQSTAFVEKVVAIGLDGMKEMAIELSLDERMQLTFSVDRPDFEHGKLVSAVMLNKSSFRHHLFQWSVGVFLNPNADAHGAAVATLHDLELYNGPAPEDDLEEEPAPAVAPKKRKAPKDPQ